MASGQPLAIFNWDGSVCWLTRVAYTGFPRRTAECVDDCSGEVRLADIFLSYARQERNDVMPIKVFVEKLGLSIFVDVEGLDAGEEFPARLQKEIESSKLVLACWSPLALSRQWVRIECATAKTLGKLFPIQIKPLTEYDMIVAFSNINYIDLTDFLSAGAHEKKRNFVGVLSRRLSEPDLLDTFDKLSRVDPEKATPVNPYEAQLEIRLRQYREIFDLLRERGEIGAMETLLEEVTKFAPGMGLEILFRLDIDRLKARAAPPAPSTSTVVETPSQEERLRRQAAVAEASKRISSKIAKTPDPALGKPLSGNKPIGRQHVLKMIALSKSTCEIGTGGQQGSFMMATGFLVEGHLLHPRWGRENVLVTANHVVSASGLPPSRLPAACFARFAIDDAPVDLPFGDILYESSPDRHDVTVLRLRGALPASVVPLSELSEANLPTREAEETGIGRVHVIGFPNGELSFSLSDNVLLDHDEDLQPFGEPVHLHYRAPTTHGSSGSPIFDGLTLQLVGLHHKSSPSLSRLKPRTGAYAASEGISIRSIRDDIQRRFG